MTTHRLSDLRSEEPDIDEVLSCLSGVWVVDELGTNRLGGEYVRKAVSLRRLAELVVDEMERRGLVNKPLDTPETEPLSNP